MQEFRQYAHYMQPRIHKMIAEVILLASMTPTKFSDTCHACPAAMSRACTPYPKQRVCLFACHFFFCAQ